MLTGIISDVTNIEIVIVTGNGFPVTVFCIQRHPCGQRSVLSKGKQFRLIARVIDGVNTVAVAKQTRCFLQRVIQRIGGQHLNTMLWICRHTATCQ